MRRRAPRFITPAFFLLLLIFPAGHSSGGTLPGIGEKIYIDIDAPGSRKIPAAVQEFIPEGNSTEDIKAFNSIKNEIRSAMTDDMEFSGIFEVIDKKAYLEEPSSGISAEKTKFTLWRTVGAELLVKGAIELKKEKLTVELRLFDTVKETEFLAKRYVGRPENPRLFAHRFMDEVMEKLTGQKGVFSTKIAFVLVSNGSKEIYTADYDGKNMRAVTENGSINLTPRWSPDGRYILYTSYISGHPCLYSAELKTGYNVALSCRPGLNLAGSLSPDGRHIALTLNGEKSPEIFLLEPSTGKYIQLTDNHAIDVSPVWSPDGSKIAFTSDAAGKPHIYMIDFHGDPPHRLTFEGTYNSQPAWSPDGKAIAFSGGSRDGYTIRVIGTDGGEARDLTAGRSDTSPSWSPDARYVVFSSKMEGRGSALYIIRKDGWGLKKINIAPGAAESPAWSPYIN